MNDKYNKYKEQELPDFIINAVSDIINQYILEHAVKDKNVILRFSKFSEFLTVKIQDGLINAHNSDFNNKEYIEEIKWSPLKANVTYAINTVTQVWRELSGINDER